MIKVMLDSAYDMFVGNAVRKWIQKKFGKDCKINIKDIDVSTSNGNTKIHIDIDATMKQEEVFNLFLEKLGL